jgi:S1-C subfamily serine protease
MDDLSRYSLMLKVTKNNCFLGQGTGFVVKFGSENYLVSNRHVLTGLDPFTNKPLSLEGDIPNVVSIRYYCPETKPEPWLLQGEKLYEDGNARWVDKSLGSEFADIAVLPLNFIPERVRLYPLELSTTPIKAEITPGMPVYIIGYPAGISVGGGWPVWITGHLASDMEHDHGGRPVFLINAKSVGGLSGSPVFTRFNDKAQFLGVHSSGLRTRELRESFISVVWRAQILQEILQSDVERFAFAQFTRLLEAI